jgi:hypothetical protein
LNGWRWRRWRWHWVGTVGEPIARQPDVSGHELVEVAIANPEHRLSGVINRRHRDAAFDLGADRRELRDKSRSTFKTAGFRTVNSDSHSI